jgi:hypothetical protein
VGQDLESRICYLQPLTQAADFFGQALALYRRIDNPGEDEQACRHWQQALALYTQLGAPEADQVGCRLSTIATHVA